MSRRYDGRTTTFSRDGRLHQVEYAMEAINLAGASIGILGKDCVVLTAEKKINSKLLDSDKKSEKVYVIDKNIICAVSGMTADANILINYARLTAQRYHFAYQDTVPVEYLVRDICDTKQGYTQYGGQRPFGVSMLYAGWDKIHGFQLYHSDPSGNYGGWKATAIGANNQNAQSLLKQEWKENLSVDEALMLSVKVMSKTMDSTTLSSDKLEFVTFTRTNEKCVYHVLTKKEVKKLVEEFKEKDKKEKLEKEKQQAKDNKK